MAIPVNRRTFTHGTVSVVGGAALGLSGGAATARPATRNRSMRFGLVTYLWGKAYSLPELIDVCEKSGIGGIELRTGHQHGVEPSLSKAERKDVKKRFADSPVTLVGYGSNAQFHEAEPEKVKANIELTKQYVRLMHDCGATGVKVKPNGFPENVSREKTIRQIGETLNEVARYAANYGQQIRVEAHGRGTQNLDVMKSIFDVANHPNVSICWNCNTVDLEGKGLEHHFNLVQDRLGATVHVHELGVGNYPYAGLMKLLASVEYQGWILLEAGGDPKDIVAALSQQVKLFTEMTSRYQ